MPFSSQIPFLAGINSHIFSNITKLVRSLDDNEKYCMLLFDEMILKLGINYNPFSDQIDGFQDLGHLGREKKFANVALVFMVRSLTQNYKVPVAYYLNEGYVPFEKLAQLIVKVVNAVQSTGLNVVATVCDMRQTNASALSKLGSTKAKPYFVVDGHKIWTIIDPPSLLKSTRNMFFLHPIECTVTVDGTQKRMVALWDDVVAVCNDDMKRSHPVLGHVTPQHLNPTRKTANKVAVAAQILSGKVANELYHAREQKRIGISALATETFVQNVDSLFDSFNGFKRKINTKKPLKTKLTKTSPHISFWQSMEKVIADWTYLRSLENGEVVHPPSQEGWLITIKAIQGLWDEHGEHLKEIRMRYVNLDPLKYVFRSICAARNLKSKPNCCQFITTLQKCVMQGLPTCTFEKDGMNDVELLNILYAMYQADRLVR